jgi:dethiobiotin synthetase
MATLYVASTETFVGKSAVCIGLLRRMQRDGFNVGYMKPVSVSVAGIPEKFPNGTEAWMWTDARVQRIYGGTNEIMKEVIARSMGLGGR